MAGQYTKLPSLSVNASNPSVGTTGSVAPTSATEAGGVDNGGLLQPLQLDVSKNLKVAVQSVPADQTVDLTKVGGSAIALGSTTSIASLPVVIANDQVAVSVKQATASNLNATVVQGTAANLNATVVQGTASNLNATVVQGTATNLKAQANTYDGSGNAITSTANALDVNIKSSGLSNQSVNLAQVGGSAVALGQAAAASSMPVTLSNENIQDMYITGQAAQTATVNNIIPATAGSAATDATGYRSGCIQVVSTGTGGTFIFECSNDNVNFQTMPCYDQSQVTGGATAAAITASSSQKIYAFSIQGRYIRLRIATTITGGSIQAFTKLSQASFSPYVQGITSVNQATVNAVQSNPWFTTATSTLTNVASSATNVTLLASNSSRKGAMIFNDSTSIVYVKFGATASATSYTVQIAPGGYFELPASPYCYTGIIDGIWAAANGNARVTEIS